MGGGTGRNRPNNQKPEIIQTDRPRQTDRDTEIRSARNVKQQKKQTVRIQQNIIHKMRPRQLPSRHTYNYLDAATYILVFWLIRLP